MCSFFLGEARRGNYGTGRKEIETLRPVKVRRKGKMLKDVKKKLKIMLKLAIGKHCRKGCKRSKKQAEPDFAVLTHNICCSVWLNQRTQRVALQSKGPVCEKGGVRIWQDGEVDGELDGWECPREKRKINVTVERLMPEHYGNKS